MSYSSALPLAPFFRAARVRSLHMSATRFFPGSQGATMHGNDPELLEKEKQKNLKGEQHADDLSAPYEGAPGWNEKLASRPEAEVKSDKHDKSPQELQKETSHKAQKSHGS